jgi:hypothetical protein
MLPGARGDLRESKNRTTIALRTRSSPGVVISQSAATCSRELAAFARGI